MTHIDAPDLGRRQVPSGTWGVQSLVTGKITVPAAAASGDVARLVKLPRGSVPVDLKAVLDGAGAAGSTADIGLEAVRGGTRGDATYFVAGGALDGAAVVRANQAKAPINLDDDDYYITATLGATAPGADIVLSVTVFYQFKGVE